MNRIVTVSDLIEQLQRYDGDKLVYTDDTEEGLMVGIRGAYGIDATNSSDSNKEYDGHVYLGMVD